MCFSRTWKKIANFIEFALSSFLPHPHSSQYESIAFKSHILIFNEAKLWRLLNTTHFILLFVVFKGVQS